MYLRKLFHKGTVVTPRESIPDGAVLIEGAKITAVGTRREVMAMAGEDPTMQVIDAGGHVITSGFIDLQVNGAGGKLFTQEPTPEALKVMALTLARYGCTGFLATIISAPLARTVAALHAVEQAVMSSPHGARVLGAHLEGPFLNPHRAGAHRREYIRSPSLRELHRYLHASDGTLRLLTLAPEQPGAMEVIREALEGRVTVALGHSSASYDQMSEAVEAGARLVTHLFNAMGPLAAREPGTAGAALALDGLSVSFIADGVHVHPALLKMALRAKGPEGCVLVTDAMTPVGTEMGQFHLYRNIVQVRDGACYTKGGILAGSLLTMDRAVANMRRFTGVSLQEALAMATVNPATLLGLDHRKGSLAPGKDADILVLDRHGAVLLTMVEGEIMYQAEEFRKSDLP